MSLPYHSHPNPPFYISPLLDDEDDEEKEEDKEDEEVSELLIAYSHHVKLQDFWSDTNEDTAGPAGGVKLRACGNLTPKRTAILGNYQGGKQLSTTNHHFCQSAGHLGRQR